MFGGLVGNIDHDQMRIDRVKQILSNNLDVEEMKDDQSVMDKDDSKFIQIFLEKKWSKYHMYFGDYNIEMFQKMCSNMSYNEYEANDTIFTKQDPWKWFYFIIKGTVHILEASSTGEDKISKIHNVNQVFGMDKSETGNQDTNVRNKIAISESKSILLMVNAFEYNSIRAHRVLSAAEQKVEFLTQNIPGMRIGKIDAIQELETLFTKEIITQGYRIVHQDRYNEDLYFIVSGECKILYNYCSNKKLKIKFDSLDESLPSLVQIGKVCKGDCFGQTSSIQRQKCKYSVQVSSNELVVYRISAKVFYDNFGKDNGAPVQRIRGKCITDNNWLNMVIKRLQAKHVGQIMSEWEFLDNSISSDAKRQAIQESPLLKKKQVGSIGELSKMEERKRMKESLLAPFINPGAARPMPSQSSGGGNDMETKYKGVFGFGTPNIRPNKRMKHMNQDQLKSRINLQKLWGNGGPAIPSKDKDANDFSVSKASDFLKKTRAAEMEFKNKAQEESGKSINNMFNKFDKPAEKKKPNANSRFLGLE